MEKKARKACVGLQGTHHPVLAGSLSKTGIPFLGETFHIEVYLCSAVVEQLVLPFARWPI